MGRQCCCGSTSSTSCWKGINQLCRILHAPPKPYLYQALEFRNDSGLPEEAKVGMTRKQLCEMWVLGVAYAPAANVRMYGTRDQGFLFHNDFNDTDARTGLFWRCPEVVRVDDSQAWREMSKVLLTIPRVVHPDDVYSACSSARNDSKCRINSFKSNARGAAQHKVHTNDT